MIKPIGTIYIAFFYTILYETYVIIKKKTHKIYKQSHSVLTNSTIVILIVNACISIVEHLPINDEILRRNKYI